MSPCFWLRQPGGQWCHLERNTGGGADRDCIYLLAGIRKQLELPRVVMPPDVPRAGKGPGARKWRAVQLLLHIFFFLSACRPLSSAACLAFVAGERWPLRPPCFYSLPFGDQPRLNYNLSPSSSFPGEIGLLWVTHQSAAVGGQLNTVFSLQVPGQTPCEESEMAHKGDTRPPLSPLTLLAATQATPRYWSIVAFMGLGEADSKIRR